MLTLNDFWDIIEKSKTLKEDRSLKQHSQNVTKILMSMDVADIKDFDFHFYEMLKISYRADLWELSTLIGCMTSDDTFLYFRCWLIGQGRTIFYNVLDNLDALLPVILQTKRSRIFGEWLLYASQNAYLLKTGNDLLKPIADHNPILVGKFEENTIYERFAEFHKKLGDCAEEDLFW
jgi:hypothetical protein